MANFASPIPISEIESVLAWVDTYKLSRATKKITRDFSDAVLLAEVLSVHYPKLVEMHNYPPRNSQALKLNNWMTLNRKVLKKLKLNLCLNTMEQLVNCAPGIIERVLIMVRDKIRRDEEANKSMNDCDQNTSSGGSYYEACGDDDHVLVVPLKTRVNGVLETVQQKVVSHNSYLTLKEELKDAKESMDVLKQKVDHLDNLLKLKEERIEELQKQLERKHSRRKEVEAIQNSLSMPFDNSVLASPAVNNEMFNLTVNSSSTKVIDVTKIPRLEESKIPVPKLDPDKVTTKSITEINIDEYPEETNLQIDKIKLDDFKEIEIIQVKSKERCDVEELKRSGGAVITPKNDKEQHLSTFNLNGEQQKALELSRGNERESISNFISMPSDTHVRISLEMNKESSVQPVKLSSTKSLEVSKIPRREDSKLSIPKCLPDKTSSRIKMIKDNGNKITSESDIEIKTNSNLDELNIQTEIQFKNFEHSDSMNSNRREYQDVDEFKDSEDTILIFVDNNTKNKPENSVFE